MKKRVYQIFSIIGLAAIVFCFAFVQGNFLGKEEIDACSEMGAEFSEAEAVEAEMFETEVSESETEQEELYKKENVETEATETETLKVKPAEEYRPELSVHFGTYRITEFLFTVYTSRNDHITDQEADMMLGRIVQITPERLVTYGPERGLGTREGRYCFTNYMVETYRIDNARYGYSKKYAGISLVSLGEIGLADAVPGELFEQLEGVIATPQLSEPYGRQWFYTFTDPDMLVLYSEVAGEYFLLERCEEEPKEEHSKWNGVETKELLEEIYGAYQVTRFLPTKFFPFEDHYGEELSKEEADMALGRIVTISEDLFVTIDNWRYSGERSWVAEAEVVNPDYRVKTMWADEIYGIRDGMLPDDLVQQEYVEVSVYPGYRSGIIHDSLPQFYLLNDGRILLYSMGQHFLLEKTGEEKAAVHEKDLSDWVGKYVYIEGDSTYQIEIREKSPGEYEAEIEADVNREPEPGYVQKWDTKCKADVSGTSERISFGFKEHMEGEAWNIGEVLLRFRRDSKTGELYTYWGKLYSYIMNIDTHDKEAGKICFVKE